MSDYAEQMQRFGAVNYYDGGETFCQPGEGIDAGIYEGKLKVSVDCYSLLDDSGGKEFDVDAWEAQTIWLEQGANQSVRDAWYQAFSLARGLVNGKTVKFSDGHLLSIQQHVAEASAPTDLTDPFDGATQTPPNADRNFVFHEGVPVTLMNVQTGCL
jgi:hypothetical protein